VQGIPFFLAENAPVHGKFFTYKSNYSQKSSLFDLSFKKTIATSNHNQGVSLSYQVGKTRESITITYDLAMAQFASEYPQIDLKYYFEAKPSKVTEKSLFSNLSNKIKDLNQREGVNYLLQFVQTGFGYMHDREQFGAENYLLIEESLLYGYNDCEDRSVLLAWLLRNLLGIKTIALDYPDHISIAAKLESVKINDEHTSWKDARYVVTDPTYIGSTTGMLMPKYKQSSPLIIDFMN